MVAVLVVYGTANAVNLTDGLDGLAAGSSAFVFAAFVIIAFSQFRHPHVYHVLAAGALDLARSSAAAMFGACAGFLWWNAAPAQIFMGDTGSLAIGGAMAGLALLTHTILLLPILGGLYVVETLSVIAQVISFRGFHRRVLRMAPIHHHFEVGGLAGVHGDRAVLAVRRALRRARARHLLRRLPPHPGGARLMRVLVIGLATTGASVVAYTRAAGHEVTVLEDRPPTRTGSLRQHDGYRARAEQAVAAGARLVEAPDAPTRPPRSAAPPTSSCPSPGVRPDHPALVAAHAAGVPVRSEIDLAADDCGAPDAPRLSRSPAPTARRRSRR